MDSLNSNWFKAYIVDILPCLLVLVYILAIIYNIAYFSVYGINVVHYLTINEMIMSIAEPLIFVALLTLFMLWLVLIAYKAWLPMINEDKKRFKNSRIYKWFQKIWHSAFMNKIRNLKYMRWRKRMDEKYDKEMEKVQFKFVGEVFLLVIFSYVLYLSFLQSVGYESGLYLAALALSLPPFLLISIIYLSLVFDGASNYFETIKKLSSVELVSAIFVYYVFGIVVFYKNGLDSGEYNLNHNTTTFEIKAADGSTFTNEKYGYVEQLNENIFLFDKQTKEVVILTKSTLNYTKIDFSNTQKGLLPSLAGHFDKLIHFDLFY